MELGNEGIVKCVDIEKLRKEDWFKMGFCTVKRCHQESVVIHKPTNNEFCERHWLDYCNESIKAWELKTKKAKKLCYNCEKVLSQEDLDGDYEVIAGGKDTPNYQPLCKKCYEEGEK